MDPTHGYETALAAATTLNDQISAARHSQNTAELLRLADALEFGIAELLTTASACEADLTNPGMSNANRLMADAALAASKRALTVMADRLTGEAG